jgi:hypothetical protein
MFRKNPLNHRLLYVLGATIALGGTALALDVQKSSHRHAQQADQPSQAEINREVSEAMKEAKAEIAQAMEQVKMETQNIKLDMGDMGDMSGPGQKVHIQPIKVHIPAIHVHVPKIHTHKDGKTVDIPEIKIDIPEMKIDIPAMDFNVPDGKGEKG